MFGFKKTKQPEDSHPDKKECVKDSFGKVIEEKNFTWNFLKEEYVCQKKKTWQRCSDGSYKPLATDYYNIDGFLITHNQYEVTPSGLRGTHTTYKYTNDLVARRTDEVMELTSDKNWKLLTKSETIFHYTKQKDVSYTETTVLDANNNLVQSILTDHTYSARGKLHSFDQFIYDKNNLLSNEFHYECTPRPICTIQKDYVPVSKNPGQVVLALAVLHDKNTLEQTIVLYHRTRPRDYSQLSAIEIKNGQISRKYQCNADGNPLEEGKENLCRTPSLPMVKPQRED